MTRPLDQGDLVRQVLRLRIAQLLVNEGLKDKKFPVPVHLALGHEALAAALCAVMEAGDQLLVTHRNIHYNLARCRSFGAEYREYLLAPDGLSEGRAGSMNLSNPAEGIPYASSILANNLPVAAGVALAERLGEDGGVTFVVTGDGAMEEGAFYESLVFMKSCRLAAVTIVENNGWSLATEIEERRSPIDLAQLSAALGLPYRRIEAADVVACAGQLDELRERALVERTPVLVEAPVKTLGFWHVADERYPETGRFINYHHGAAPDAAMAEWPVLEESDEDPVHVLAAHGDAAELTALAREIRAGLMAEIA